MTAPQFLKLDPKLFRRLPAGRKQAAALAAWRIWAPQTTLEEAAASLGIGLSTARRWAQWLIEIRDGVEPDRPGRRPPGSQKRNARAVGGAVGGAPSSIGSDLKRGEGETYETTTPHPPDPTPSQNGDTMSGDSEDLPAVVRKADEVGERVRLLARAYLARTIHDRVTEAEAHGRIHEAVREGGAEPALLAAYLKATPHVTCYPRHLAREAAVWNERQAAEAFRARLREIRRRGLTEARRKTDSGIEVGRVRFVDPRADPPRLIIEIDRTPPAPTREDAIDDYRASLAAFRFASDSPMARRLRAEIARLEAGADPPPAEVEIERLDLTRAEDLDPWSFRPEQPRLFEM